MHCDAVIAALCVVESSCRGFRSFRAARRATGYSGLGGALFVGDCLGLRGLGLTGSSGGALAAVNAALEAPDLVRRVIADSFEGETTLKAFTQNVVEDREASKRDENARMFYYYMHGDDWEQVVDNDTEAIRRHDETIGRFFHKSLETLKPDILMTGSKEDEFICALEPGFFERVYGDMIRKIGHGEIHLFDTGGHPAMLSNPEAFLERSRRFLES